MTTPINRQAIRALAQQYQEKANAVTYAKMLEQENTKPIFASINNFVVTKNSVVTSTTITADSDGDFQFTGITGSWTTSGTYPTDGYVKVQITDQASGYKLTQGYVPLHLLVNPGFISSSALPQRFYPTPFHFTLLRSTTLQFDFICTIVDNSATVNILLEGKKVY